MIFVLVAEVEGGGGFLGNPVLLFLFAALMVLLWAVFACFTGGQQKAAQRPADTTPDQKPVVSAGPIRDVVTASVGGAVRLTREDRFFAVASRRQVHPDARATDFLSFALATRPRSLGCCSTCVAAAAWGWGRPTGAAA